MGYDGIVVVGTKLDTKDFEAEIKYVEHKLEEINTVLKDETIEYEFRIKNEAEASRLAKQLDKLKEKQKKLEQGKFPQIKDIINSINDSMSKTISKVGKWALGIFAIESAYGFVRRTMSTLSQYNEKIASDVEYINFALASMLQPVIEGLINLAYKLLTYVNYIAKAWFGVDLFANASADAMNRSAKSAEKMKKSLAGFDEMNVLNDNGTTGAMGVTPSMDLTTPEDVPIPSWLQWIAENKDIVIAGLIGIAGGLTAINLGLSFMQGLGITLILAGISMLIADIIEFIKDPSWEDFFNILGDIAIVIGGIMLVMGNWWGLLIVIIGALVKLVAENWEKIKEILGNVGSWIYEHIIKPVGDFFANLWEGIKTGFGSVVQFFNSMISKIVGIFKTIGTKVGDAISGAFKAVINGVLKAIESILNFPIKSINKLINVINKIPGINLGTLPTFKLPRLAVGGVVNMPGKGINYGGANIGERGAEGVIPLTNSQMMAQLGEAIGKYISINATVPVYVGNRQIAREIKKITADSDFATNS